MERTCLIVAVLFLCGCGHNITTYSKGVGASLSWETGSVIPSARLGVFETVTSCHKENVEMRYSANTGMGWDLFGIGTLAAMFKKGNDANMSSGTVLELKSGPMTTGYVHKVLTSENVRPEHVEIAKSIYAVKSKLESNENSLGPDGVRSNASPVVTTEESLIGAKVTTPVHELTKDAIDSQVKVTTWQGLLKSWGLHILAAILAVVAMVLFVFMRSVSKINQALNGLGQLKSEGEKKGED